MTRLEHIKLGHVRVHMGKRAIDVVEYRGRWALNLFPDPPQYRDTQSAACFLAGLILTSEQETAS